jgi:malonate-semialdehyde dehydrogenase (acetylating)/methylmalonate-semialdehyde dehydrogenase
MLNVVNGDKEAVDAILDDPDIQAVGFVGSTPIAEYIYTRGAANGKRVQCFGGAKNHMIIMPDADMDQAVDALIGAGYGSAGERCMAISVAVPVGKEDRRPAVEKLIPRVEELKIGPSTDGPARTSAAGDARASGEGQELRRHRREGRREAEGRRPRLQDAGLRERLLHGRLPVRQRHAGHAHLQGRDLRPVLSVVRAKDYDEALKLANDHEYGNGVAIFTARRRRGARLRSRVNVGMVGINVPIPVPLAYHTFGGWKRSASAT